MQKLYFVIDKMEYLGLRKAKTKKMIDVGCAEGTLLKLVNKGFPNIETYGVEPGDLICKLNRGKALKCGHIYWHLSSILLQRNKNLEI